MNLGSLLSIVLFALVFIGVAQANDQQLQQTCMNAMCACLRLGLARQVADLISKHINCVNAAVPYGIRAK